MQVMVCGRERATANEIIDIFHPEPEVGLVATASGVCVDLVVEGCIVDVDLVRSNASDRAITLVQLRAMESEMALV